uniref:Uncharacterized protein n=1 Tax=Oryza brachyantha TaxID=4533 RepID=J3KUS9_ORYBR
MANNELPPTNLVGCDDARLVVVVSGSMKRTTTPRLPPFLAFLVLLLVDLASRLFCRPRAVCRRPSGGVPYKRMRHASHQFHVVEKMLISHEHHLIN